jgi:hypothetical protein
MLSTAIICPQCRRVVAIGAGLPATCFAGIPEPERRTLPRRSLESHPAAHLDCVELELTVPDELAGRPLLREAERLHADEIAALAELVPLLKPTP